MSTCVTATPTDIAVGAEDIDSLTFSFYTPTRIRRESVMAVTKGESFDMLGHSVVGGVYDLRMGAMKGGDGASVCGTCGQLHGLCGGHPGHIELRECAYNPLTFNFAYTMARGMCWYCHSFYCFDRTGANKYVLRSLYACLQCINEHHLLAAEKYWELYHHLRSFASDTKPENFDAAVKHFAANFIKHFPDTEADSEADVPNTEGVEALRRTVVHEMMRELQGAMSAGAQCPNCGCPKVKAVKRDDARSKIMLAGYFPEAFGQGSSRSGGTAQHMSSSDKMALFKKLLGETPAERNLTYVTPARVRQQFVDTAAAYRAQNGLVLQILNALFNIPEHPAEDAPHDFYELLFLTTLSVMPNRFRPMLAVGEVRSEHPYSAIYKNIVTLNNMLDLEDEALQAEHRVTRTEVVIAIQLLLNKLITGLKLNSMNVTTSTGISSSLITASLTTGPSIKETLEKKQGLFRKNMMGKRVNFAARSVISPDPYLNTNEIGLPLYFSTHLAYPEPVTPRNVEWLKRLVINGPNVYPGALWIEDEWGNTVRLLARDKKQRMNEAMKLLLVDSSGSGAGAGAAGAGAANATGGARNRGYKIVYRHLKDGDMALVNRQPTLHKPGIMAHRVRVLSTERTIRMHYSNCSTYNADFDGDEMNVHVPQGELARAEARTIAFTDEQYLVPKDGSPLRGLIQDSVITGVLLTKRDTFFERADFQKLLYSCLFNVNVHHWIETPLPAVLKPVPLWTGKQLISCILKHTTVGMPPINHEGNGKVAPTLWGRGGYHSTAPAKSVGDPHAPAWFVPDIINAWSGANENVCVVRQSELLAGVLDKAQFGASAYGLVHSCYELYGSGVAGTLLSVLGRLLVVYMQQYHGFTCGMDDLLLKPDAEATRRLLLHAANNRSRDVTVEVASQGVLLQDTESEANGGGARSDLVREGLTAIRRDPAKASALDSSVKRAVNKLASRVIDECLPGGTIKPFPHNCMGLMTGSGARGSNVNASQISCLLGQQELEGRRVPLMMTGRTLPSFPRFDTSARAGGFVMDRFLTGVRPQEFFFHCMAGREGLIDTAVKTARSGYLQHSLMKCMESLTVGYDYTVRDSADGSVVQFTYGEDALDVCKTAYLGRFQFWLNNFDAFAERYHLRDSIAKYTSADGKHSGARDIKECSRLIAECIAHPAEHDPYNSQYLPTERLGLFSEKYYTSLAGFINEHSATKADPLHDKKQQRRFQGLMSLKYSRSLVNPGEPVGVLASQSIGEPSTQMTLNTFHLAGRGDMNVTLGMPRLKELLMSAKVDIATPSMTIALRTRDGRPFASDDADKDATTKVAKLLSRLTLLDIVQDIKLTESLRMEDGQRVRCYEIDILYKKDYETTVFSDYEITRTEFQQLMSRFEKQLRILVAKQLHRKPLDASIGITSVRREDIAVGAEDYNEDDDDDDENEGKKKSSGSKKKGHKSEESEDAENVREKRKMAKNYEDGSDDEGDNDVSDSDSESETEHKKNAASDDEDEDDTKMKDDEEEEEEGGKRAKSSKKELHDQLSITITMAASDKVMMMQLVEDCVEATVLHECKGIRRCFVSEADPKPTRPDQSRYVVQTEGVNFVAVMSLATLLEESPNHFSYVIDVDTVNSNDVHKVLHFYGVEAARAVLVREVGSVFKAYGIKVDHRHLSLVGEYMMFDGTYRSFSRNGSGISCSASPLLQISFETAGTFLLNAAAFNRTDNLCTPSAALVAGLPVHTGTGAFFQVEQVLDPALLRNSSAATEGVDIGEEDDEGVAVKTAMDDDEQEAEPVKPQRVPHVKHERVPKKEISA